MTKSFTLICLFLALSYQASAQCCGPRQYVETVQQGLCPNTQQIITNVSPNQQQIITNVSPNQQQFITNVSPNQQQIVTNVSPNQVVTNQVTTNQVTANQLIAKPRPNQVTQVIQPQFLNNPILPNQCVPNYVNNPIIANQVPVIPNPVLATTVVDNSVANSLANALQLLIVSDLIESTMTSRAEIATPCIDSRVDIKYQQYPQQFEVISPNGQFIEYGPVENYYTGYQEIVGPVTEVFLPQSQQSPCNSCLNYIDQPCGCGNNNGYYY